MKTVALIQARMSSTRFPNKVLSDLAGVPMIVYMVRRARRAKTLDDVVVVTSVDSSDDPLAEVLEAHGIGCFRGDLDDVLARYTAAADYYGTNVVVRLTGDCPLVDPAIVDLVVRARRLSDVEYASNIDPPSFPDGFDVEVFTAAALRRAYVEARLPSEREHVTPWMRTTAAGFRQMNCSAIANLSALRLTVDYPDDLEAVRAVVAAVDNGKADFDLFDVLRCLAWREDIRDLNAHARNEGYADSLAADRRLPASGAKNEAL